MLVAEDQTAATPPGTPPLVFPTWNLPPATRPSLLKGRKLAGRTMVAEGVSGSQVGSSGTETLDGPTVAVPGFQR